MRKAIRGLITISVFFISAIGAGQAHAQNGPPPPPPPPYIGPIKLNDNAFVRFTTSGSAAAWTNKSKTELSPGVQHEKSAFEERAQAGEEYSFVSVDGGVDWSTWIPGTPQPSVWTGCVQLHGRAFVRKAGQHEWTKVDDSIFRFCLGPDDPGSVGQSGGYHGSRSQFGYTRTGIIYSVYNQDSSYDCAGDTKGFTSGPDGRSAYSRGLCYPGPVSQLSQHLPPGQVPVGLAAGLSAGDEYRMVLHLADDGGMNLEFTEHWTLKQGPHSESAAGDCDHSPADWTIDPTRAPPLTLPGKTCGTLTTESNLICAGTWDC